MNQKEIKSTIKLNNKIVIVTGSTRGIGKAIAESCAAAGAKLIISGRKQDQANAIAKEIATTYNTETLGVACDVSNAKSCQDLVKACLDQFGTIDILINNAGITKDNILLRMKDQEWEDVVQTNLNSVFYMTKAVSRTMLKKKYGKIINISSVVGITGNPGQANYAAAKAGINGFTKSVAKELGAKNIFCNAIAPGFIDTDMIDSLPTEYIDNIISNIPLKKLGTTADVSNLTLFLASDLSNYITGQVISVDGGMNT